MTRALARVDGLVKFKMTPKILEFQISFILIIFSIFAFWSSHVSKSPK